MAFFPLYGICGACGIVDREERGSFVILDQSLSQTYRLLLTQKMRQSLQILQLPAISLRDFLQEVSLSNPVLEVEEPPLGEAIYELQKAAVAREELRDLPIERREQIIWENGGGEERDYSTFASQPESFSDYLNSQIGQMTGLDNDMQAKCQYLIGCLNSAGYLDCPLNELAQDLGCDLFSLEQALYVVQSLDPPGVGARSLSECLLLQLVEGEHFNAVNIHLVRDGLPLLAKNDVDGLSKLLGVGKAEVKRAAAIIRSLNPIPSSGFYTGSRTVYTIPEATVRPGAEGMVIEMNSTVLPKVTISQENCALLKGTDSREAHLYLKEKLAEANTLISSLEERQNTMFRLIEGIVKLQEGFFTRDEELRPMTMVQIAENLGVNTSTVSRAVKDKYIQVGSRIVSLRSLFTTSLQSGEGTEVSSASAKLQIKKLIAAEPPEKPLSDEVLSSALAGMNIHLSRRTVAKYRGEMGIPPACRRKKQ